MTARDKQMEIADGVSSHDFRSTMRHVVSSVAIVTARAGDVRNGLTATAVCSVSAEPPTVLACVNRNASAEAVIAESGCFAINFLTEDQHGIARLFSTPKLAEDDRFGEGAWLSLASGSPILGGAAASFDCKVEQRIVAGTHHIYIGRVLAVASVDRDALLYRDGMFRKLQKNELAPR
jgi:flavin reductase (DIM6/NTAB) family NADH-FMN oxidoreductase RutF